MGKLRYTYAVVLLLLGITFWGCTGQTEKPNGENKLDYLRGAITVKGLLSVGESDYEIELVSTDGKTGKLTFSQPENMRGYVFEKADDGYYVGYGDLRVPLRADTVPGGAGMLFELLSPQNDAVTYREEKVNGIEMAVYTYPMGADGQIVLYTKKADATPLRVEFDSRLGSGVLHITQAEY